jgi:hypothetical protein
VRPTFVLLHSPLVGPATWLPVAAVLRRRGRDVVVPSLRHVAAAEPPYWPAAVDAAVAAVGPHRSDVVLVPHSNAGLLAPAVADRLALLGHHVRYVFVDAALAGPGPDAPLAPPDLLAMLEPMADGRLLPRWTDWWDPADVARLLPEDVLGRIVDDQPRLPLDYFRQRVHLPPGWADRPGAYLRFSSAYEEEATRAHALGWPVHHLPGGHLHAAADPDAVAAAVLDLSG